MSQRDDEALLGSSFLSGVNASYLEQLQARYETDPGSVDPEWRTFFDRLDDSRDDVVKSAEGASWKRPNWPVLANGEMTAALDGNWGLAEAAIATKIKARAETPAPDSKASNGKAVEAKPAPAGISDEDLRRATRDSLRALMMIRAFRLRGHLHANLDPLGLEPEREKQEITPEAYGFAQADYDRPIFIDGVLGLETATVREMLDILRRTYCSTIGFEFMHVSDPDEKAWMQLRIEGRTSPSPSRARASAPSCRNWSRPRVSRSSLMSATLVRSASASTAPRP